ncbi:3-oxoacyl-[acyl-carrier protein] reductase [Asanoa ferruginea]|uniref:3-oxoacyl-[acyl-carrier protein] reductase n=1 Tax=Asanoa ferruginea TaxID=53367 RepID=A0A3D9ZRD0_9ACTN|nr:SDR family oxidoreductase [Asanoa ferruginea]REF99439.1 3-oxoacyl-[acyl-carrier protein] reductase [Asanoa ferruginea]GIF49371.1 dehydrogenase [Asanoa ferruginea]
MINWTRPLDGRNALVIGGGGDGIGRAISRAFAAAGAAVAVADIDPGRAEAAVAELTGSGARALALAGDVRSRSAADEFVGATVAEFGRLDTLVTVVGGQVAFVPAVRLHEMSDDDWDLAYEMNLGYVARAVRAAIRAFLAQGQGGSIVSVGSVTGTMAAPMQASYGAAKAGLVSLAKTVAAEYAADGIRMNVVACGAISTAVANTGQAADDVPEIPLRRLGVPDDAAAAAVYLASPLSSYVTGQSLGVDGGVTVRGPFS